MSSEPNLVNFYSEDVDFHLSDNSKQINWIQATVEEEGRSIENLNIIFCSDDYLLQVNKDYLSQDYYTDIITFEYNKDPVEGDLFISIDRVNENAKELKIVFMDELNRVIIHGVLHLLGYSDDTPDQKDKIRGKEDYYLVKLPGVG